MKHDAYLATNTTNSNDGSEQVAVEASNKKILFYQKSPTTVFWLSLLTLNFYNLYWFYRQWRNIRDSTGERYRPLGRAIFSIFYINQLITKVSTAAQAHGNSPWKGGVKEAVIYLLAALVGAGAGRAETHSATDEVLSWVFIILTSVIIAFIIKGIQQAANYHNEQVLGNEYDFKSTFVGKVYAGEAIITGIGVLLVLIAVGYGVFAIATNSFPQGSQAEIAAQETVMNDLSKQAQDCNDNLERQRDTVDATDQAAVDTFNSDRDTCVATQQKATDAIAEYKRLAGITNVE